MATPLPLPLPYLYRTKATQPTHPRWRLCIKCADSSTPNRGFGSNSRKNDKKERKSSSSQQSSTASPYQAPGLSSSAGGKIKYTSPEDLEFQQRLEQVRKSALVQKKAEEEKQYGAIDYDAPTQTTSSTDSVGLGTKIQCFMVDWRWSCCPCVWVGICTWRLSSFWKDFQEYLMSCCGRGVAIRGMIACSIQMPYKTGDFEGF